MNSYALEEFIESAAAENATYALAYAVLKLARAQQETAAQIKRVGLADADSPMGAMELLSGEFKRMADALQLIAAKSAD